MTARTDSHRSVQRRAWDTREGFRSLLIPIDLSPGSDRVVGRVARLPLADDARLTLVHVIPKSLSARARGRAERDAGKALTAEAKDLARRLAKHVAIQSVVRVGAAAVEIAKCASSVKAELIVMGRGGGRAFRDVVLGSTAERVIRRGQLPVLAVRLPPRALYRRPALALDLDQAAHGILASLLQVIPPRRPSVTVIHAYEVPYQGLIYPSLSEDDAEEHRDHYRQKALHELAKLLTTSLARAKVAPGDAPSWRMHVRCGSPRTIIEKAVKKADADLLVLGTHGYSGVAHAFLGTVAGDVLREVACDVLVVPPRRDASGTT
jgi:nucleotide-binding universal stress UspA family protein